MLSTTTPENWTVLLEAATPQGRTTQGRQFHQATTRIRMTGSGDLPWNQHTTPSMLITIDNSNVVR